MGGGFGRAPDQGRPGRGARPHDQHLEPAGGGARDRVPADPSPLRARGRLRRRRAATAAAWGCGASTAPTDCHLRVDISRQRSPCWGLYGGGRARTGSKRPRHRNSQGHGGAAAGQWFEMVTPGAGGYGRPGRAIGPRSRAILPRASSARRYGARSTADSRGICRPQICLGCLAFHLLGPRPTLRP